MIFLSLMLLHCTLISFLPLLVSDPHIPPIHLHTHILLVSTKNQYKKVVPFPLISLLLSFTKLNNFLKLKTDKTGTSIGRGREWWTWYSTHKIFNKTLKLLDYSSHKLWVVHEIWYLSLNKYLFVPSTLLHIYVCFDIKYIYFIRSFMLNYIKASSFKLYLFILKFWKHQE